MNLLLLHPDEIIIRDQQQTNTAAPACIRLDDWRAAHIIQTLRARCGDTIKIGVRDGGLGIASIIALDAERACVELACDPLALNTPPPPASPVRLFVALPRPKAARRIVRLAAECGVKSLHFINGYKVEKSYWSSPLLTPEKIDEQIILGLQQAMDTMPPTVYLQRRFKPFVEDVLPGLIAGQTTLLAHPDAPAIDGAGATEIASLLSRLPNNTTSRTPNSTPNSTPNRTPTRATLNIVLGPEGGFIPYELEKLIACGATPFGLGARIYRTEIAAALLLGQIHALIGKPAIGSLS